MDFKKIKKILNYIGKLLSSAVLVVLIIVGLFLVYYLITVKKAANDINYEPRINLYTIVSGSMTPSINVYDVVVDYKVDNASDIKVGDVITFRSTSAISKDLIVTHRVIDIKIVNGEIQYVTKGDYNATADSDTAKFENVIGRVILRFPQLGRVQFFLASKMGWFIVVLLPAACVIIYDFIKLFKLIMLKKDADKIIGKDNNVVIESEVIAKEQSKEKKQEVQKAQVNNIDIKKIKEKLINNFNKIKIKLKELFSRCIKRKKKCDKEEEIINDALEKIKNTDYTESLSDLKKYNDKK